MTLRAEPLARAYAACERLARSHYENFPVASRLLPAPMRPHVAAVYAFARIADDIADEGEAPGADRRQRLAAWKRRLHAAIAAEHSQQTVETADADQDYGSILVALAHSIRALDLPVACFDDLVSAFAQDTMTVRYTSWADLFDYCRRSAQPIGRLVLRIAGYRDERLDRSSDALCTALQLTNFWQDLGRDWHAGRLYVPEETISTFGADVTTLVDGKWNESWSRALSACVSVTADLFREGRFVCDGVRGRLKYELRLTWLGGRRILERVEHLSSLARARASIIARPALGSGDAMMLLWRAVRWAAQR